jgi:hypothetical protein
VTQSLWALDERIGFLTDLPQTGSSLGEGELQNNYTTFFKCIQYEISDPTLQGNYI